MNVHDHEEGEEIPEDPGFRGLGGWGFRDLGV